jgi:hypothetical protein
MTGSLAEVAELGINEVLILCEVRWAKLGLPTVLTKKPKQTAPELQVKSLLTGAILRFA